MPDNIKHPAHYAFGKYEPVKVIRDWNLNFNLGNVIKYVARADHKYNKLEDLKKARQYLDFEIEELENQHEEKKQGYAKMVYGNPLANSKTRE